MEKNAFTAPFKAKKELASLIARRARRRRTLDTPARMPPQGKTFLDHQVFIHNGNGGFENLHEMLTALLASSKSGATIIVGSPARVIRNGRSCAIDEGKSLAGRKCVVVGMIMRVFCRLHSGL